MRKNDVNSYFKSQFEDIIQNQNLNMTRAKWLNEDNAYAYSIYGDVRQYYLKEGLFPISNVRHIASKSAFDEILWIYQKRSNNIKDLNSHIWDSWTDESGSIGQSYGAILNKEYNGFLNNNKDIFGDKPFLNQVEFLFQELCQNPLNRRIMTNMFDFNELNNTLLPPCAFQTLWSVNKEKNELNMSLVQRSGDFLVAGHSGGWNCVQYAFLLILVAKSCGYVPNIFTHFVQDLHLYDKHYELYSNFLQERFETCTDLNETTLKIELGDNPTHDLQIAWERFNSFTLDKVEIINYTNYEKISRIEVAV